jgi:hypothetical protein
MLRVIWFKYYILIGTSPCPLTVIPHPLLVSLLIFQLILCEIGVVKAWTFKANATTLEANATTLEAKASP